MKIEDTQIRPYQAEDEAQLIALWQACDLIRPWNDPKLDIERKLDVLPELFLVVEYQGTLIGSVIGGYDGHRGVVNYLAVHPSHRTQGWGRKLMRDIEDALTELGCPKINLMVRAGNLDVQEFYKRLGYEPQQVVVYGKRLIED